MCQSNPRKLTPLHRAIISGNYHALKLILESPLFLDSHSLTDYLPSEIQNVALIDLHRQDSMGRTARDYAHKIVFMSKLLC